MNDPNCLNLTCSERNYEDKELCLGWRIIYWRKKTFKNVSYKVRKQVNLTALDEH